MSNKILTNYQKQELKMWFGKDFDFTGITYEKAQKLINQKRQEKEDSIKESQRTIFSGEELARPFDHWLED